MREEGERIERDLVDKIVSGTAKIDNNGNLLMNSIPELTTSNTKTNTTHEHERVKRFVGLLTRPVLTRLLAVGGRTVSRGAAGFRGTLGHARTSLPVWTRQAFTRYIAPTGFFLGVDHGLRHLMNRGTMAITHSAAGQVTTAMLRQRVLALTATGIARWRHLALSKPALHKSIIFGVGAAAVGTASALAAELINEAMQTDNSTFLDKWADQTISHLSEASGIPLDQTRAVVHNTGLASIEGALQTVDAYNNAIDSASAEISTDQLPKKIKPEGKYPAISLLTQVMTQTDEEAKDMRRLVRRAAEHKDSFWKIFDETEEDSKVATAAAAATTTTVPTTTVTTTAPPTTTTTTPAPATKTGTTTSTEVTPDQFWTVDDFTPQARSQSLPLGSDPTTSEKDTARRTIVCDVLKNVGLSCDENMPITTRTMHPILTGMLSTMAAVLIVGALVCTCQCARRCKQQTAAEVHTWRNSDPAIIESAWPGHPGRNPEGTRPSPDGDTAETAPQQLPPATNAQCDNEVRTPPMRAPTRPGKLSPDTKRQSKDHLEDTMAIGLKTIRSDHDTSHWQLE